MSDNRQSLSDLKDIASAAPAAEAPVAAEASEATEATIEAAAPEAPVQPAAPLREREVDAQGRAYATGRRKDAVARVWLKPGTGKITVNNRDSEVYFARPTLRLVMNQVFQVAGREGQYDVICTVKGGAARRRPFSMADLFL